MLNKWLVNWILVNTNGPAIVTDWYIEPFYAFSGNTTVELKKKKREQNYSSDLKKL